RLDVRAGQRATAAAGGDGRLVVRGGGARDRAVRVPQRQTGMRPVRIAPRPERSANSFADDNDEPGGWYRSGLGQGGNGDTGSRNDSGGNDGDDDGDGGDTGGDTGGGHTGGGDTGGGDTGDGDTGSGDAGGGGDSGGDSGGGGTGGGDKGDG